MNPYLLRPEHLDQRRADPGDQRIAAGQCHDELIVVTDQQRGQLLAEVLRPGDAGLTGRPGKQVQVPGAAYDQIRAAYEVPGLLIERPPTGRAHTDHLDHGLDPSPARCAMMPGGEGRGIRCESGTVPPL
jgi:hypothetical protein